MLKPFITATVIVVKYLICRNTINIEAINYFKQTILTLKHCHSLKICHWSLKLEDILVDKNNNVKIKNI